MLDVPEKTKKDSFRPLSGSYISQYYKTQTYHYEDETVSVPYRGATFLNNFPPSVGQPGTLVFPSPIGELHFSIPTRRSFGMQEYRPFPSPIGELHFSIKRLLLTGTSWRVSVPYRGATFLNWSNSPVQLKVLFPSPIGELHFSIIMTFARIIKFENVSVPYRGATFLNTIPATPCPVWDE